MKFAIIEIKGNDTYVIYDMENKGACCCTAYTIKQLLESKVQIAGVGVQNGRLKLYETDLEGKKRTKKAGNTCSNLTKRSAVTILKGLDEKHYPREVKARRGTGSYVHIECTTKDDNAYVKYDNQVGVLVTPEKILLECGKVITLSKAEQYCKIKTLQPEEVKNLAYMEELYAGHKVYMSNLEKYDAKMDDINKKKVALQKQIDKLENERETIHTQRQGYVENYFSIIQTKAVQEKYSYIKGNEKLKYSFYSSAGNTATIDCMKILLQKTKRKILYTDGLRYRKPSTMDVPITNEQALQIIARNSMVDIDATDSKVIKVNTYSANDMW